METKELGIITIKGYFNNLETEKDERVRHLAFKCPNKECIRHNKVGHEHTITMLVTKIPSQELINEYGEFVWSYQEVNSFKIAVSPSLLWRNDFHCGIPTYFDIVLSKDLL